MDKSLKKNARYEVRFDDHAIGCESVECEIVAVYLRSTRAAHIFTWWKVITKDKEIFDNNLEEVSIVKGAILSIREV